MTKIIRKRTAGIFAGVAALTALTGASVLAGTTFPSQTDFNEGQYCLTQLSPEQCAANPDAVTFAIGDNIPQYFRSVRYPAAFKLQNPSKGQSYVKIGKSIYIVDKSDRSVEDIIEVPGLWD